MFITVASYKGGVGNFLKKTQGFFAEAVEGAFKAYFPICAPCMPPGAEDVPLPFQEGEPAVQGSSRD